MKREGPRRYIRTACAGSLAGAVALALGCGAKRLEFSGGGGTPSVPPGAGGVPSGSDACDMTTPLVVGFLQVDCAPCHADPRTYDAFDFVLDISRLEWQPSAHTQDPETMMAARYIVPGDPNHSLLYTHISDRKHPIQPADPAAPQVPLAPNASDLSLLFFWISNCLGASPVDRTGAGGSTGMAGSSTIGPGCAAADPSPDNRLGTLLWPNDDACQGDQLAMVGTWDGYVENIVFPSGSDAVHMVIRSANAMRVCGSVAFGAVSPPPPVDPTRGYPPDVFQCPTDGSGAPAVVRTVAHFDTFPMTMLDGRSNGARLQFRSTVEELWKPWCDLQPSYPVAGAPGVYSCLPPDACTGALSDCGARMVCNPPNNGSPCRCASNGCTADPANANNLGGQLTFDLRVIGDNADGSVDTGAMGVRNLHLTRTP